MKKRITQIAAAAMTVLLMGGCGSQEGGSAQSAPAPEEPLAVETLRVELCYTASPETLLQAVEELPALLAPQVEAAGVEVGEITVTLGTSGSATGAAIEEGGVDVAVMPAADSVRYAPEAACVLTSPAPGTATVLYATPSDYGVAIGDRAEETEMLGWSELSHGVWGVLEEDSLNGYRLPNLWLSDHYEGSALADVSELRFYQSYEELLRAAAAEEVDVVVLPEGVEESYETLWTMDSTRTDESGVHGFGRRSPMEEELRPIATTDRVPTGSVVFSAEIGENEKLTEALKNAFLALFEDPAAQELMESLGEQGGYGPAQEEELDALRRMLTIEGETW